MRAYAADAGTAASLEAILAGGQGEATPTLAEALRAAGYRTAALIDREAFPGGAELLRGFDDVRRLPIREARSDDDRSAGSLARAVARRPLVAVLAGGERPWLLFVLAVESPGDRPRSSSLGVILSELRAHEVDTRTLVAVTADHGPDEPPGAAAGAPSEQRIRVELLLRPPHGCEPRTVEHPISLRALAPSLLALAGVAPDVLGPSPWAESRVRLGDWLLGDPPGAPPPVVHSGDGATRVVIEERYKLVRYATHAGGGDDARDGRLRLFDLAADPRERRDLAGQRPAVQRRLERALDAVNEEPLSPP